MPLFERPDFEALLNPAVKKAEETIPPAPPGPVPVAAKELPKPAASEPDEVAHGHARKQRRRLVHVGLVGLLASRVRLRFKA